MEKHRISKVELTSCEVGLRPRAVNTARPYTAPVNDVRATRVNAGKPQLNDKGFVDSGCSRHMTRNIAYLSDFKEFDRGYVTFRGGTHGGRISELEIPKAHHISKDISLSLYSVGDLWLNFGMIWVNTDIEVCLMVLTFIHGLYIDMDPHEFSHVYLVVSNFITSKSILVLLGQKVNTASTNINASMLPLVLLEGNLVFLITVEIVKALTSFIGEVEIKATIDGHDKTITEASVRSPLQLADADGISNMSTTKFFE
ncbi:hypothetical protein Tco_1482026 [Tanacetum coccineum]